MADPAFTIKDWKDDPDPSTPLSAAAHEDIETRLSQYIDSRSIGRLVNLGNMGAAQTVELPIANTTVRGTLNAASCTIGFTIATAGRGMFLELKQDATGGRRVTFTGVTFLRGAGQVNPTANATDLFWLYSPDGSAIYGVQLTQAATVQSLAAMSGVLEVLPRVLCGNARSLTGGTLLLTHFVPDRDFTASKITTACVGTNASGLTKGRMGLMQYTGAGAYTTIARCANDTALWASNAFFTKAIADDGASAISSVLLKAGVTYALAVLAVGTTMPQLAGLPAGANFFHGTSGTDITAVLNGTVGSQTDLGASASGATPGASALWGALT